tara:strand:+ start:1093 stop:1857 length:765 start_codon:yes stop_codon:yes gene_type:complete
VGNRLEDKVAIVTGAGSGIGQATAVRFGEEGARVVIADMDEASSRETQSGIEAAGGESEIIPTDVAGVDQVERLMKNTLDRFGRVDILVNSAATLINTPLLQDTEESDWDRMMEVNLRGTFLCCKYVLPAMSDGGGGTIVNLAAMSAYRGPTPSIPYEVAKAGVIHLTKASAYQYTPLGIRINCIAPGNVETPMLKQGTGDAESWARRQEAQPMKRFGQPEELANAILFVASDEASWVSGVTIIVDGGKWAALQ